MAKEVSKVNKAQSYETALISGNLAELSVEERLNYYKNICDSLGLNSLTKPFEYITLNGKLQLYATKACTEQLRSARGVSLRITDRQYVNDCYMVTASACLPDNRCDESTGVVSIAGLKGDSLANALMKAETKAKRRATLSICGLGWLDESEIETIPGAQVGEPRPLPKAEPKAKPAVVVEAERVFGPVEVTTEDNPWNYVITTEQSPSRGKALWQLPPAAWDKIEANPEAALRHFVEADRYAVMAALANPMAHPANGHFEG